MDLIEKFNKYIDTILESLDSDIDIKWVDGENIIFGYFTVNNINYRLEFIRQIGDNWSYSFSYESNGEYLYEIPTNIRSDGFKVLSAVKKGLYYLYEMINPNSVIFSAIDKSDTRKRLYHSFCISFSNEKNLSISNRGDSNRQLYLLFKKNLTNNEKKIL